MPIALQHALDRRFGLGALLTLTAVSGLASCTSDAAVPTAQGSSPAVSDYVALGRGVHPLARPELDRGPLDPATRISNLSLVFKLSAAQRSERDALKKALLDPGSASYHRWLSPEQYAARFGAGAADIERATTWLASQGLQVHGASPLGTRVTFSGTVAALQAAFRASMHRYEVRGEMHRALSAPPQVPVDLADIVLDVTNTHDFHARRSVDPQSVPVPDYRVGTTNGFAPPDWANVYDVATLYTTGIGGTPITGSGVTIAVVGHALIAQSDVDAWRSTFGLGTSTVTTTLVPNTGTAQAANGWGAQGVLDVEWSGGIAKGATVNYVYTGADDGNLDDAAYYVIENNLAPVLSQGSGECEGIDLQAGFSSGDQNVVDVYASAANLLGITYLAPAGDTGAAGCLGFGGTAGLYVATPASYPGVTAVGGTAFATGSLTTGGNGYFTAYSSGEHVWNDANTPPGVAAGGGGISSLFTRPDYQSGIATCPIVGSLPVGGVVPANMRQLPDVSFTAGGQGTSIPLFFECTLAGTDCGSTGGAPVLYPSSGTTFAVSAFAGIVALMNQVSGGRLGDINPLLYAIHSSTPAAFHDITSGNDEVTCSAGMDPGCGSGGLYGYAAAAGYDCASGLGSVDALNLLTAVSSLARTTSVLVPGTTSTSEGTMVGLTATVTVPTPNTSALGGNVAFTFQSYSAAGTPDLAWTIGTSAIAAGTVASGVATLTAAIPAGLVNPGSQYVDVVAVYEGDAHHLPSTSAKARITFSPLTLCISPVTANVQTAANLAFSSTGGLSPVSWFTRHDSTCDSSGNCSSIDSTLGTFVSGPNPGYVVVGALDSAGAEQIANVTVGTPGADAGPPPWGAMGTPPGACTMPVDGGTDGATPDAGAHPDAGDDAGGRPDGSTPSDASMAADGSSMDAAIDTSSGSPSPDAAADASMDATSAGAGSGNSSGCGCTVVSDGPGSLAGASLSLLALACVALRRRAAAAEARRESGEGAGEGRGDREGAHRTRILRRHALWYIRRA
jgi:hypothetical protein